MKIVHEVTMGPSGSGKTTLLTALASRLPSNISATISYNNNPFSAAIKRQIGFVPPDDLFTIQTAIFVFNQERAILVKERSSGMYRLSSYFVAQIVGIMPMELLIAAMYVMVSYWMNGLKASAPTFIQTILITLLNVLASQGLGHAIGASLKDAKQAITLASVMATAFLLLGGYYATRLPDFIAWLKHFSYNYYSFKLLLGVQYTENETYDCQVGLHCKVFYFPIVKLMGVDMKWLSVVVMILNVVRL